MKLNKPIHVFKLEGCIFHLLWNLLWFLVHLKLYFLWWLTKSKMLRGENLMRQLRNRCQLDLLKKVSAMVDSPEVNPVLPVDDTVDIVPCGSVADSIVGVSVE